MILTGTLYIIYNQRLAFPQWYELVGPGRGGGWRVRRGSGSLEGEVPGVTERAGILRKLASHKPYNVVRAPAFIYHNLYFRPYTQP